MLTLQNLQRMLSFPPQLPSIRWRPKGVMAAIALPASISVEVERNIAVVPREDFAFEPPVSDLDVKGKVSFFGRGLPKAEIHLTGEELKEDGYTTTTDFNGAYLLRPGFNVEPGYFGVRKQKRIKVTATTPGLPEGAPSIPGWPANLEMASAEEVITWRDIFILFGRLWDGPIEGRLLIGSEVILSQTVDVWGWTFFPVPQIVGAKRAYPASFELGPAPAGVVGYPVVYLEIVVVVEGALVGVGGAGLQLLPEQSFKFTIPE